MIRLRRLHVFLIGTAAIFAVMFINRIQHRMKSETTVGYIVGSKLVKTPAFMGDTLNEEFVLVRYKVKDKPYELLLDEPGDYHFNLAVPVLYYKEDPAKSWPDTFVGFWYKPMLWSLAIVLLVLAACLSFLEKGEGLRWRFGRGTKKEATDNNDPNRKKIGTESLQQ